MSVRVFLELFVLYIVRVGLQWRCSRKLFCACFCVNNVRENKEEKNVTGSVKIHRENILNTSGQGHDAGRCSTRTQSVSWHSPHSSANKENDPHISGSLTSQCRSMLYSFCCTHWLTFVLIASPTNLPRVKQSCGLYFNCNKIPFHPETFSHIIHISILQCGVVYIWSKYCLSETDMSVYSHGPTHHPPVEMRSGFLSGKLVPRPPTASWRWSRHQHTILPRLLGTRS